VRRGAYPALPDHLSASSTHRTVLALFSLLTKAAISEFFIVSNGCVPLGVSKPEKNLFQTSVASEHAISQS
jgi:hypothetical protein